MPSTIRFLHEYLSPKPRRVEVRELTYHCEGKALPATLYRSTGQGHDGPGWVLLHGLTYRGRAHPSLDRFARALAVSGATVIVPEIPEWSALHVAPDLTGPAIDGAVDTLIEERLVPEDRIGVLGFSFGATQALSAVADPVLSGRIRAIVAWGGYCDLHCLFRFGLTGRYELDGIEALSTPDPYGTWIMGANFIREIPGFRSYTPLADALHQLALESGRAGVIAIDEIYDPLKARLRRDLPIPQRELFDLLAPPASGWPNDSPTALEFADTLADAALSSESLLDPRPLLPDLSTRTLIAHGRGDQLIPYTESLRLRRALPKDCPASCTITSLFAHSTGATSGRQGAIGQVIEAGRFYGLLHRLLRLI